MGGGGSKLKSGEEEREFGRNHDGVSSVSKVNERDLIEYYEHQLDKTGRESDKHGRALVVDDSKFNRKILGKTIEVFFSDVDFAENGLEALNMVTIALESHNDYSIIFMDSMMPVMGGIESTGLIRELGFTGMIVGVTGDITAEDNKRFLDSGVNDVMLKPLLLPHVESILLGKFSGKAHCYISSMRVIQFYTKAAFIFYHASYLLQFYLANISYPVISRPLLCVILISLYNAVLFMYSSTDLAEARSKKPKPHKVTPPLPIFEPKS